eukprot:gene12560-biopygen8160
MHKSPESCGQNPKRFSGPEGCRGGRGCPNETPIGGGKYNNASCRAPFSLQDACGLIFRELAFGARSRVLRLDLQRDRLAGQRLHEDLHPAPEAEDEVQRALLLDIVGVGRGVRSPPTGLEFPARGRGPCWRRLSSAISFNQSVKSSRSRR